MKHKLSRETKFTPIKVEITLETEKEVRQFINLLEDSDYSDDYEKLADDLDDGLD